MIEEVLFFARLGVSYAWTLAHWMEDTPDEWRLKGSTGGFPVVKLDSLAPLEAKCRVGLRPIDRIHVSKVLCL